MPVPGAKLDALALERCLRGLLKHDRIRVHPHGRHLVIDLLPADGEAETVARLTRVNRDSYVPAFRDPTRRWEPLPGEGSMEKMAEAVVTTLGPYLDPANY
jgi:hypothetical protein